MTAAPVPRPPASPSAAPIRPLLQLLRLARPLRGQLVLAVLAGALSTGCAVALLGTSGFLLARASLHPNILAISVAVVAVRGLSVGRGVFRYVERLASHEAAFRVLADVRVRVYRQLARLAPAGLRDFRSGDLLARLVSDVDATQDLFIRGLAPPLTAALVGAGAAAAVALILAPAGLVLAAGLLVAGLAVSWLAAARAGQAARRTAPARGELTARVTDLLAGAADLHAAGAQDAALAAADEADHELTRLARRSAAGAALGSGLSQAVAGLTLWGVLLLGVAAVGGGTLTRVPLAVLTLTALAVFEAVTALPAAAIQLGQARASAARVGAVLDAPDPVAEPVTPRPLPAGPLRVSLRGAQVRYQPDGPLAIDGVDLDLAAGRRVALLGPSGSGKSTVAAVLLRFVDLAGGTATLGGADLASYAPAEVRTVISGCTEDPHLFDTTIADNIRLARPGASEPELDEVAAPGPAADLDPVPATWLGHHGRPRWHRGVRRRTPADRAGPGPAGRPAAAHPGRAGRAPRPGQPAGADRRPAGRDGRPGHPAHHARPGRPGPGGRDRRAGTWPGGGTRHAPGTAPRRWPVPADARGGAVR